ncbi:MAG: ATP-binding protein [Pseudohongiellaceae bacterium]
MPEPKRVILSWSSGKDSAWTLHTLHRQNVEVVALLTTFNEAFDRVAMHGTRRALVEAQAEAAGIPLFPVFLPWPCSNADYEKIMGAALAQMKAQFQPTHVAFGDLFLEDIRAYRETQMANTGLELLFPIWQQPTDELARQMTAAGLQAVITCVDPKQMPASFAGRRFDRELLDELPASVDPCGENGEFHSFVFSGPMFSKAIAIDIGETVERDGFVFTDVDFAPEHSA